MKLNNKGFTLIEVLAVVVILAMLMAIMVPSVNTMMNKNKQDNYESMKTTFLKATKIYLSDYRYKITINGTCSSDDDSLNVTSINNQTLENSKLPIQLLVDSGNIKTDQSGSIIDPRDKTKTLNLTDSYVLIKYQCNKKDYTYTVEDHYLVWQ